MLHEHQLISEVRRTLNSRKEDYEPHSSTQYSQHKSLKSQFRNSFHCIVGVVWSGAHDGPALVRVVVNQKGIDVETSLFGPDGSKISFEDTSSQFPDQGAETLWAIAEGSGAYRLVVSTSSPKEKLGRYELTLAEVRDAAPVDRIRVSGKACAE